MKDKEAREDIKYIKEDVHKLQEFRSDLRNRVTELEIKGQSITVRHCPACNHDTMQRKHTNDSTTSQYSWYIEGSYYVSKAENPYDYDCLNCGSKLKCECRESCEVVKEE